MNKLKLYGLTDRFINESSDYKELALARIISQYKGIYKIVTLEGEQLAKVSGKFRYETYDNTNFPAVGDFVMVSYKTKKDMAIIHEILTRKSVFSRKAVGKTENSQVLATNIDILFICMSLNNNYNLNRLERYISIAWDSGATPVIVLTKSDLSKNLSEVIEEVEEVSSFSDVIVTSMFEDNIEKLKPYFKEGITTAFIGSSGVGKSTLINEILGNEVIETKEIGYEDKGKHTTTRRELFVCPFGGVVIDTPGMRELGVQSIEMSKSFSDIEELSKYCKFNNCTHTNEPNCAVKKALSDGEIDQRRLDNYFKLKNESSYEGLSSKQIENKKFNRLFKEVGGMKNARKLVKNRRK